MEAAWERKSTEENLSTFTKVPTQLDADDAEYLLAHCVGNGIVGKEETAILYEIVEAYKVKTPVTAKHFGVLARCVFSPKRKNVLYDKIVPIYILVQVTQEDTVRAIHIRHSLDAILQSFPKGACTGRILKALTQIDLTAAVLSYVGMSVEFAYKQLRHHGFTELKISITSEVTS